MRKLVQQFDFILFDESFSEFKPKSTSHWFKGVQFKNILYTNLDLSEVADMSYMFENCKKEDFDLNAFSFSNHPKVTGMFSGSQIHLIKVQNERIEEVDDDIFVGIGSETNPCYLECSPPVSQILDVNDSVYYYKGGYFLRPHNKEYVTSSGYWLSIGDWDNGDESYFASRSIEFHYDSLYKEKPYYRSFYSLSDFENNSKYCDMYLGPEGGPVGMWYGGWEDIEVFFDFNKHGWTTHGITSYYDNWAGNRCLAPSAIPISFDPSFANARPKSTKSWFDFTEAGRGEASNCIFFYDTEGPLRISKMTQEDSGIELSIEGLCYLNTSEVTDMSYMFGCNYYYYYDIQNLDLSHFDTSKVKDMSGMFSNCRFTESPNLSNFNTSNVTNMSRMFYNVRTSEHVQSVRTVKSVS